MTAWINYLISLTSLILLKPSLTYPGNLDQLPLSREAVLQSHLAICDSLRTNLKRWDDQFAMDMDDFKGFVGRRSQLVVSVEVCEKIHSELIENYQGQSLRTFFDDRLTALVASDLGIGSLKLPDRMDHVQLMLRLRSEILRQDFDGGLQMFDRFGLIYDKDPKIPDGKPRSVTLEESGDAADLLENRLNGKTSDRLEIQSVPKESRRPINRSRVGPR